MKYRLALFDFDGTLADSFAFFCEAYNELAPGLRLRTLGGAELERTRGMGPRELMRLLGVTWWKVPILATRMRRRMASETERIRLFDGVPEMLRALADAGVALGVVTSNAERNVRAVLGPSADLVRHWSCETSMFGKAARFKALLGATKLAPGEVVCVGDELRDAEAARRARIDFGAATWGYATRAALVAFEPAMVCDSIDQVAPQILNRGNTDE